MTRLRCSVALATCNGAAYLEDQLRSIREQSRLPDEIIVVDDASDDDSLQVVRTLIRGLPLLAERNPTRIGVTANFERVCRKASGDIILLCDQDDIWHREKIERMMAEFERRPELLLLHSDARLVDRMGAPLGRTLFSALGITSSELRRIHTGQAYRVLFRRNVVTGATTAFRRLLLAFALPFPPVWLHDEWLAIIAASIGMVDALEVPLIDYRQHGGNQVGANHKSWLARYREVSSGKVARRKCLVGRATALSDRLMRLGAKVPEPIRSMSGQNLSHAIARAGMPSSRIARLSSIALEIGTGRYTCCSRGLRTVLADLVEPIAPCETIAEIVEN